MASEDQLKAFREITLNIYMGHLIVSGYYRTKLARYKTIIQSLCDRGVGNIRIKKLLQKNQEIIPLILNPYFKRDGGRISTRKKTTYDRMKEKQTEEEKKPSRDQGVNTEETMMTNINENEQKEETLQSGSGLLYVGNRKRKAASPPGMRPPQKKRKTMWLTFK